MNEKKGCCEALAERVDELETAMLALIEGLDVRLCGLEQRAADVEKAAEEFLDRGTATSGYWTCLVCGIAKPNPYGDPKAYSGICRECVEKQKAG